MNIVFFGAGEFGIPALDALKKSTHHIVGVVTLQDKPAGRHRRLEASPVKIWAAKNHISCLEFQKENSPARIESLKKLGADVFIVISFGVILPKAILAIPKQLAINVHASLLPRYRGASPIQTALLNGDTETGVTVMQMAEALDAGPVIVQKKIDVLPEDDAKTLSLRLGNLGAAALLEALESLGAHRALFEPQNEKLVTWTKKIKKEDGRLNWNDSAANIHNRIRAFASWPGTFSFYEGKRILILKASVQKGIREAAPGTLLKASASEGLWVATGDCPLSLELIQAEGRKAMPAGDFLKGFPLKKGTRLE